MSDAPKKPTRKTAKKTTAKKPRKNAKLSASVHHKRQQNFLVAIRRTGNITRAAEEAAVARSAHYDWMNDPGYAEQFRDAMEEARDRLEAECWRRAVEGVEEPTGWYQGAAGGTIRKYSDSLLMFLTKAARPERFRENYALEQRLAMLEAAFTELVQHATRNGAQQARRFNIVP